MSSNSESPTQGADAQSLQRLSISLLESYKVAQGSQGRKGRGAGHPNKQARNGAGSGPPAAVTGLAQGCSPTTDAQPCHSPPHQPPGSRQAKAPVDSSGSGEAACAPPRLKLPLPAAAAARGAAPAQGAAAAAGDPLQGASGDPAASVPSTSRTSARDRSARSVGGSSPQQRWEGVAKVPGGHRGSVASVQGAGGGNGNAGAKAAAARSSMALRDSVLALLGTREKLASRISEDTPTILPPSDRPAIMQVLELPPAQRGGPKELAPVQRVLQKVPLLSGLETQALTELSRWVRYQFLEPGSVVFNQGDIGALFYIIASGKVSVSVTPPPAQAANPEGIVGQPPAAAQQQTASAQQQQQPQQPAGPPQQAQQPASPAPALAEEQQQQQLQQQPAAAALPVPAAIVLEAGQSFGEKALTKAGLGRRTATVAAVTECELLTLDIQQYQALLAKVHEEDLAAKVEVLRGFELTAGWSEQQLREVAGVLTLKKFPADRVVLHQGSPATSALYFIKSGEVRVVRHLPASDRLRRLLSNSVMAAQFQPDSRLRDRLKDTALSSSNPGGGQLSARSAAAELARHMLPYDEAAGGPEDVYVEIATLGPHELFGGVGEAAAAAAAAGEGEWRRASILTSTYTELLELTRHDLLTRLKGGCRVALESVCEHYANDEALLESVAEEVEWQRYKHRLIAGVLGGAHLGRLVDYRQGGGSGGGSQKR